MRKTALSLALCLLLCSCSIGQEEVPETETAELAISEAVSETAETTGAVPPDEAAELYAVPAAAAERGPTGSPQDGENIICLETPIVFASYSFDDTYSGFEGKTLVLEMTGGSYDSRKSYYGAAWSGKFRFRLTENGKSSFYECSESDIVSPVPDLNFNERFELSVDDYNNDGIPDFSVNQWGTLSGGGYCRLFSLLPNGTVVQKRIDDGISPLEDTLWLPSKYNSVYSPLFEKESGNRFSVTYFTSRGVTKYDIPLLSEDIITKWFEDPRHEGAVMSNFDLKNIYEWTDDAVILAEQQILEPDGSVWTADKSI